MAMGRIIGRMDASTPVSGRMASSTEMAHLQQHLVWKDRGTGRMERGLVGQITSDLCNN